MSITESNSFASHPPLRRQIHRVIVRIHQLVLHPFLITSHPNRSTLPTFFSTCFSCSPTSLSNVNSFKMLIPALTLFPIRRRLGVVLDQTDVGPLVFAFERDDEAGLREKPVRRRVRGGT